MEREEIIRFNRSYWDANADRWFGTTALPAYGVFCPTEEDLHLFGDVSGKKVLDLCCGSGHSLKYLADRNAGELWGVDYSRKQIENAERLLAESGYGARLICSPMEADVGLPEAYFDYVYSIYGIGWTTDLDGTFRRIASSLKKDGVFIFSWHHTLNYCVSVEDRKDVINRDGLVMNRSYFDESWFRMPADGGEVILCNRMISTYVNALAKAGFVIERMVEQTDEAAMRREGEIGIRAVKAKMLPISVLFKARKL